MKLLCLAIAFALVGTSIPLPAQAAIKHYQLSIPRQSLDSALKEFAKQTGLQVARFTDTGATADVGPLDGRLTVEQALRALLAESGLTWRMVNERTIAVEGARRADEGTPLSLQGTPSSGEEKKGFWSRFRLAQADTSQSPEGSDSKNGSEGPKENKNPSSRDSEKKVMELEEVVVTGTHVRGAQPTAPVQVFTREDFDRAGAVTAEEVLKLLPQNFGGTQSSDTAESAIPGLAFDLGYGSSVNLRGVGGASTLVLVDGRRVAASGTAGFSDISMIPLAAVERIEVMTDGASALYGSDAIGGVVNFILRKDFSGAETRLRYGAATEGGIAQRQASQLFGTRWGSGNAVITLEHVYQDELDRLDRDFSANAPGTNNYPRPLVPGQKSSSAALFAKQQLGDRVQLSFSSGYSERDGDGFSWDPSNLLMQDIAVKRKQYGAGAGVTVDLGHSWQASVNGNADRGGMRRTILSPLQRFDYDSMTDLRSATAQLAGDLWQLPSGAIKVAVGADYREESLDGQQYLNGVLRVGTSVDTSVSTKAAYGELSIPLGSRDERSRAPIEVSLAGRYEEQGSFGNTFDPKYGLRWSPVETLSFYASYGTSFKVASLEQRDQYRNVVSIVNLADAGVGGTTRTLRRAGNNKNLTEETAETLSAGVEFSLPVGDGLQGSLNYFDIDYTDRIAIVSASVFNILALPEYRSLLIRRGDIPDAAFNALLAEQLTGTEGRILGCPVPLDPVTGACAAPLAPINAIIDHRLQNFSSVQVQGLDLSLTQRIDMGESALRVSFDASYLLAFDQALTPTASEASILGTLYNPVDFRFRTMASWDREDWQVALAANYTDDYSTRNSVLQGTSGLLPVTKIDSWLIFDLTFNYRRGDKIGGLLQDVDVGLALTNLFDEDPPFVDDQYLGLGYDPANADPRGRFIGVSLTKSW